MVFVFAVMVFIGVFFFNCWMIPLTVVPSIGSVKPEIYYFASDPPLDFAGFTSHSDRGYVCYQFWFYWNHDAYVQNYDDWEPVYVYYTSDGSLYALAYRVHWEWLTMKEDIQVSPDGQPLIVFYNEFHTPCNVIIDLDGYVTSDYTLQHDVIIPEGNEPTDPWEVLTDAPDRTTMLYWRGIKYGFIGFGAVMVVGVLVTGGWGTKLRR